MSITDELREWASAHKGWNLFDLQLNAIADRIDEQHEQMQYDYQHEFDGWKFIRDTRWVELPVDADGKVIHVEDEVELLDGSNRFKAEWLEWDGEDWAVHVTIGYGAYHEPSSLRHVKPDTWERIIEDAQEYVTDDEPLYSVSELVERCRRLAGAE